MLKLKKIGSCNKNVKSPTSLVMNNKKNSKLYQLFILNLLYRAYAEQTDTLNRMRGMLEDEMTQKR